ncbi:MAG: cysteine-rich KTR domain-containing protein [Clostridia bacterium]|nr:cysteine-rich KTR domain-containing protein [Clostridia bacterium]
MTYYTVCHDCGYKLFKAGEGSNLEIYCPKCKAKMIIEIKNGKITIQKTISDFYLQLD